MNAYNQKEFFFTRETTTTYEKPFSDPVITQGLYWCGDLAFTNLNNSSKPTGFSGRCVSGFWGGYKAAAEAGAELEFEDEEKSFTDTMGFLLSS